MALIWIVNPFDPLPGDPEQPGRYVSLARLLREAGHEVVWWTSTFSHRFKKPVDRERIQAACDREGIGVRFIECPAYTKNVSFARLRAHRVYARGFLERVDDEPVPDVMVASNPPLDSPAAVAQYKERVGARMIVDVQDIWIDNFRRFLPGAIRWSWPILFRPWIRANRYAYRRADAVVGVAQGYADEGKLYRDEAYRQQVVPLGIALEEFDEAAGRGNVIPGEKPRGEIWSIYSGSLSRSYDAMTVAKVALRIARERDDVRFFFSGRGENETAIREMVGDQPRITFLGFAPFEDWAATVRQCDIGWNAIRPENLILFPNKIFYYWAAGLAIMNTIPGECADHVERLGTGFTYRAGDVDDAYGQFSRLIEDRDKLEMRCNASRQSAETTWRRSELYRPYVELIEDMAGVKG